MEPISRRGLFKMGAALTAASSLVRSLGAAQRPATGQDAGTLQPMRVCNCATGVVVHVLKIVPRVPASGRHPAGAARVVVCVRFFVEG